MSFFAKNLKFLRENKGISKSELSKKINVNQSTLSRWENEEMGVTVDNAFDVANFFDISMADLVGKDLTDGIDERIETTNKTIKIPVLGKVPAGIPIEAIEDILGYEEIPEAMMNNGTNYFALKVDGDSMLPDYKTGDVLIVKQQSDCNSGDDCIVMVNGNDATFKRVIKQEKSIILKPLNNTYEPYYFNEYEIKAKPVKIIGVAIEVRRKLK